MKKLCATLLVLVMCLSLMACSPSNDEQAPSGQISSAPESSVQPSEAEADEALVSEPEKSESISFSELKADDSVSFTGQVVSSIKDGEDTICVQIQQDGRWVACYCQLQSEFIEKAAELETADIVSVKGLFSNMIDMKQENTAVLVYLYDCEISK